MGNRAVITFDKKPTSNSLGIYLHWNGGPESILAFIQVARTLKVRSSESDPSYAFARLVQIIGNFFGGTDSIGVGLLNNLDTNNYDNGVMYVAWTETDVNIVQWSDGDFNKPGVAVDLLEIMQNNAYWKPNDNGETIFNHVLNQNNLINWK